MWQCGISSLHENTQKEITSAYNPQYISTRAGSSHPLQSPISPLTDLSTFPPSRLLPETKITKPKKKVVAFFVRHVSSLCRGHANLLCIFSFLTICLTAYTKEVTWLIKGGLGMGMGMGLELERLGSRRARMSQSEM